MYQQSPKGFVLWVSWSHQIANKYIRISTDSTEQDWCLLVSGYLGICEEEFQTLDVGCKFLGLRTEFLNPPNRTPPALVASVMYRYGPRSRTIETKSIGKYNS